MEPAVVTVIVTIVLTVMLKTIDRHFAKSKDKVTAAKEPLSLPEPTIYHCPLFVSRLFEKRLVEAGIMTEDEMLKCDNPDCPECYERTPVPRPPSTITLKTPPRGPAPGGKRLDLTDREKFDTLKKTDPRYKGYRYEDWKFQEELRRSVKSKTPVTLRVVRPDELPPQAMPYELIRLGFGEQYHIRWEWDDERLIRMVYNQPLTADKHDLRTGDGSIRLTFVTLYDERTGRYVGWCKEDDEVVIKVSEEAEAHEVHAWGRKEPVATYYAMDFNTQVTCIICGDDEIHTHCEEREPPGVVGPAGAVGPAAEGPMTCAVGDCTKPGMHTHYKELS